MKILFILTLLTFKLQAEISESECASNSAMTWSPNLNRCVGKIEAKRCMDLKETKAKNDCYLALSQNVSGVGLQTNSANGITQGQISQMNGGYLGTVGAYYLQTTLQTTGANANDPKNTCISHNLFHITSIASVLSDYVIRRMTENRFHDLRQKYSDSVNANEHTAQSKALIYLREEQDTIKNAANIEKNRNLLVMAGYASAAIAAGIEIFTPLSNPECSKFNENSKRILSGMMK